MKEIIDQKDKKIIHLLSANARKPDSQIAKLIGLSRAAVTYRIKRLEKLGIIKKYLTWINTLELGYKNFHIYLKIKNFTPEKKKSILKVLSENPNIKWLVSIGWSYDLFFVISAKNTPDLDKNLKELYSKFSEDIFSTRIHLVESVVREIPPFFSESVKFPEEITINKIKDSSKIDKTDLEILNIISENARMNAVDIKTKLEKKIKKLTPEAISYRIKKLKSQGIIKKFSAVIDYQKLGTSWIMIIFKLNKITNDLDKEINNLVGRTKTINYVDKTIDHRIRFQIFAKNVNEIHETISQIRSKFDEYTEEYEVIPLLEEHILTTMPEGVYLDLLR